jgi:hypothetical protein
MMGLPLWFKTLVLSEITVQLPFFFIATYAFLSACHFQAGPLFCCAAPPDLARQHEFCCGHQTSGASV